MSNNGYNVAVMHQQMMQERWNEYMQFNSLEFLFYFLPVFMAVYVFVPQRYRNAALVVGSLAYYAFASNGNYWWVLLLAAVTVAAYFAGLTLNKPGKSGLLCLYLVALTGILVFFKLFKGGRYLPSGMSFYLFQIAAYLIDTYHPAENAKYAKNTSARCETEKNFLTFASQIVMFPKLLSGPLMNPSDLRNQHYGATVSRSNIREGLQLLIIGLGFKVILANRIGGLWSEAGVAGYAYISVPFAWLALTAYAMQLYFDFYGYSLMAMGLGKMMGYDLPRNFDSPYASKTVSEFYRRWHITLGRWFRDYLYIPLGGNRNGTLMTIFNLAVVWLFTGLWHGVGGNYLLWAGFLFLLIVNERLWLGKLLKNSRVLCHVYLVFVILLSWVPFAVGDWDKMVTFLGRLLGLTGSTVNSRDFIFSGADYVSMLVAGVIFATPVPRKIWERIKHTFVADLIIVALFWAVVYLISTAAQDPFMYFQY